MIRAAVERLAPFAAARGIRLDAAAIERITAVVARLEVWNRKTRLTGDRDVETIVSKHCADSLAAASVLGPGVRAIDVGSGAGFPGLVAACVRPDVHLTLVDSRQKACSFLDAAAAQASLVNVRVVNQRVERLSMSDSEARSYGAVMSRGVELSPLLGPIRRLTTPTGAFFMMMSGRQTVPEKELVGAGFRMASEVAYTLPTGEGRRIVCYAPA